MMLSYMTVGVYDDRFSADMALSAFLGSDFDLGQLSVVGKEHHRKICADDYRSTADRTLYAGKFGTFWVAGPLAASIVHGLDLTPPMAELSALGVGLYMQGIPCEVAAEYDAAVRADKYLLVVCGNEVDADQAAAIMLAGAARVQLHTAKVSDPGE